MPILRRYIAGQEAATQRARRREPLALVVVIAMGIGAPVASSYDPYVVARIGDVRVRVEVPTSTDTALTSLGVRAASQLARVMEQRVLLQRPLVILIRPLQDGEQPFGAIPAAYSAADADTILLAVSGLALARSVGLRLGGSTPERWSEKALVGTGFHEIGHVVEEDERRRQGDRGEANADAMLLRLAIAEGDSQLVSITTSFLENISVPDGAFSGALPHSLLRQRVQTIACIQAAASGRDIACEGEWGSIRRDLAPFLRFQ